MSFDSSIQHGRVTLTIHRAESLVALNPDGSSNPCVVATIGQQSQTTAVVPKSTNPAFDTTFVFTGCPLPTILTLKVINKSNGGAATGGAEELLGSATLTLFSASPMTRRLVQLSHGGNVSLSQRARSGCGAVDVSYEVTNMPPGEAASAQRRSVDVELPAFLKDDSELMNFTSSYAAIDKPAPPPQVGVPSASTAAVDAQQTTQQQQQPPPQASVTAAQFPAMPSPTPAAVQPQQSYTFNPTTNAMQTNGTAPPSVHSSTERVTLQNPPPGVAVPLPPPPPSVVPFQPLSSNSSLPAVAAPPPPPPVRRSIESSDGLSFQAPHFPNGANAPTPAGQPVPPPPQPMHTPLPLTDGGSTQEQTRRTSDVMVRVDSVRQVPPSPLRQSIQAIPVATQPSVQSNSTTSSSTSTDSSPTTSTHDRPRQQELPPPPPPPARSLSVPGTSGISAAQPLESSSSLLLRPPNINTGAAPAPPATTTTAPAPPPISTADATGKVDEKPKKRVTVIAAERKQSGGAVNTSNTTTTTIGGSGTKKSLRAVSAGADRGVRQTAASTTPDTRRTSSANTGRSSSRGRASTSTSTSTSTTPMGTAHHPPVLYQWPDELLAAAAEGNTALFQKLREDDPLLSRGFESVRDYSGRTILHLAAWYGHTDVLKTLLQASPSVPIIELRALRSRNGNTILHSAAQGGRGDVVRWLRFGHPATGTLLGLRNMRGFTATDCAREAGFMEIAAMLDES